LYTGMNICTAARL